MNIKNILFPSGRKSGSALLVTLLVVSLLLVIVLTYVVFVRLELRKVILHQHHLQARSNARLGLELAISKLQETAGPDTRVTAPAFSGAAVRPNSLLIGQALDSAPFIADNAGLALNENYAKTLGYFISHDAAGAFNPATYWPYLGGTALQDGNTLLVGPGSTLTTDEDSDGVPDGYVAAPLQEIPGADPAQAEGHYAYHIRDNGLQAQINLIDEFHRETGRMDSREQAATAQKTGSEILLPGFDPAREEDMALINRVVTSRQLDLTSFTGTDGVKELFHHITLQSYGLPVNVITGGLKRDLIPVIQEAEANGGLIQDEGEQWQNLINHQATRMQRWFDQTEALKTASRPPDLPDHHWNALHAVRLREDQNQPTGRHVNQRNSNLEAPELREKIFPPMSDLDIRWDPGGASWRQLLTYPTMKQRLENNSGVLVAGQVSEAEKTITPVVARFAMSYYFTLDWPTLRLHSIPLFVLWNPYNEPLRVPDNHHWQYNWKFQTNHFDGFGIRFQFANPGWQSNQEIWTPTYFVGANTWGYGGEFRFRLLANDGTSNVVIPPGEAVFFTMYEHQKIETEILPPSYRQDWRWKDLFVTRGIATVENNIINLREGLHGFGGYTFYVEHEDLNERFLNLIHRGPRRSHGDKWWNENHSWNDWDSAGFPFAVYIDPDTGTEVDGSRPARGPETHGSDYPVNYATNRVSGPIRGIAINEVGFDPSKGWELTDAQMDLGRADFRSRGMYLKPIPNSNPEQNPGNNPWVTIPWLYMRMPSGFTDGFTPLGQPAPEFDETQPLNDSYPQFPTWGTVWGLRMPDPVINQSGRFAAPSRWLVDYNPTAPFQIHDPVGRTRAESHRGAYMNPASYMGGFSQFPGEFNGSELTMNEKNQSIGLSDDPASMRFDSMEAIPRLVLFDVPNDSEDMVNVASFMHAGPHSIAHAWAWRTGRYNSTPTPIEPRWFASEHDTGSAPGTDYAPSSPVYPIGNSFAPVLVPRDKAVNSYYPAPMAASTSEESIPYAEGKYPNGEDYLTSGNNSISYFPGYDTSYLYNTVLWDDFFFTPDSNRRLLWSEHTPDRDFNTSAANVQIAGAFNVNSTSVSAWAALLGSMLDVEIPNQVNGGEVSNDERAPFSRFLNPVTPAYSPNAGEDFESAYAYSGYRRLTEDEIVTLAEKIVDQVKLRGPFLSMADFVNRQLIPADDDEHDLGLSGALQSAIAAAGLNDTMGEPTDHIWMQPSDFEGSWTDAPGHSAFYGMNLDHAEGSRAAGSPGYLMQADILSGIGSVLQARSDTFTIRAYGELQQPSGTKNARAWIEATVQRVPEFIEEHNEVTLSGNRPEALPLDLTALNQRFGRKFKIISLRWLSEEEI